MLQLLQRYHPQMDATPYLHPFVLFERTHTHTHTHTNTLVYSITASCMHPREDDHVTNSKVTRTRR